MSVSELPADEYVLRALTERMYDESKGRFSAEVFGKAGTSVSRLSILDFNEIAKIFCQDLHCPPDSELLGCVRISVGALKAFGENFESNGKAEPKQISIDPKPVLNVQGIVDNPAHAEIRQKIPRTLSFDIMKTLTIEEITC